MKMHFVLAALLMIGAAGCSTMPTSQDQATVTSAARGDVPATVESSDIATTSSDSTIPADPMGGSAPSSLGASSSGRGH